MTEHEFNRRMVRTVLTVAGVGILIATLWAARNALMLVYVSALVAMGFSPLVRLIERPATRKRRRAMPRVLAIFAVYLAIIGIFVVIGLLVIPPLVDQATTLWERLPQHFNDLQRVLVRYKLETRTVTLQEAVQECAGRIGRQRRVDRLDRHLQRRGRRLRPHHDHHSQLLLAHRRRIGDDVRDAFHLAQPARMRRRPRARRWPK